MNINYDALSTLINGLVYLGIVWMIMLWVWTVIVILWVLNGCPANKGQQGPQPSDQSPGESCHESGH